MSFIGMASLLAGAGQGYLQGQRQQQEDERRAKLDQITFDRAAREKAEADRAAAQQAERDAAGAPLPVDENLNPAAPGSAPTYSVGMQQFNDRAAATAAASDPAAMQQRQLAVMQRQDPARAASLEKTQLDLTESKRAAAAREFDGGLHTAALGGWDQLATYLSDSGAKPTKLRFVPDSSGRMVVNILNEDGTLKPTATAFPNDENGIRMAAVTFSKATTDAEKLDHYEKAAEAKRRAANDTRKLDIEQQDANTRQKVGDANADYLSGRNDTSEANAAARAAGRGAGAVDRMSEIDKATYADLNKRREKLDDAITKAKAEGSWDDKSENAASLKSQRAALEMKAAALAARYSQDDGGADPLGVRGNQGPQPQTGMQAVVADMKRNGIKNATANVDGQTATFGAGATMAQAARPAVAPPSAVVQAPAVDPTEAWVMGKLMGPLDGPRKLAEIAAKHPNAQVRAAAASLLQKEQARAAQPTEQTQSAPM